MDSVQRRRRIRWTLGLIIASLLLSGLGTIPLQWLVGVLCRMLLANRDLHELAPGLVAWVEGVLAQLTGAAQQTLLNYTLDWLSLAQVAVALVFIGPWRAPVRNAWVVDWGLISCGLIVVAAPLAVLWRGIPVAWAVVDVLLGVGGFAGLWLCRRDLRHLAAAPPATA